MSVLADICNCGSDFCHREWRRSKEPFCGEELMAAVWAFTDIAMRGLCVVFFVSKRQLINLHHTTIYVSGLFHCV